MKEGLAMGRCVAYLGVDKKTIGRKLGTKMLNATLFWNRRVGIVKIQKVVHRVLQERNPEVD